MVNYAIPTSPGTARILHKVVGDRRKLDKKIQRIAGFKPDLLVCKDHMENSAVIDGDGVFLHYQVKLSRMSICKAVTHGCCCTLCRSFCISGFCTCSILAQESAQQMRSHGLLNCPACWR